MSPNPRRAIAERAQTQLGLITLNQLDELEVTRAQRRTLVGPTLEPLGHRTFRIIGSPPTWEQRVLAGCLDLGGAAAYSSAARLLDLSPNAHRPGVEIVTTRRRTRHGPWPWTAHSTTNLSADDITQVGPIPCIGIPRTLLMLAGQPGMSPSRVRDLVIDALTRRRVNPAWIWWRLEAVRCRGRSGVALLESTLRERQRLGASDSWLEHTFLLLLEAHGLPRPRLQARIERAGNFVGRVDFVYDHARVVVEVEGHREHSTAEQRRADEARRRDLVLAGYRVLVFTYVEVVSQPEKVVADLTAALAQLAA